MCLKSGKIELKDDVQYLEYFVNNQPIGEFMAKIDVWGEDLTRYEGFEQEVIENVKKIQRGICLV